MREIQNVVAVGPFGVRVEVIVVLARRPGVVQIDAASVAGDAVEGILDPCASKGLCEGEGRIGGHPRDG